MKPSEVRRGSVCMICGKPSKQQICESCRVKLEAEAIHHKLQTEKSGEREK